MLNTESSTSLAWVLDYSGMIAPYDEFWIYKMIFYKLIFGSLAIVGHIFPVFAGFKGGKGVATLLGMMLAVHHTATLLCVGVFVVVLFTFRYVSLGSLLATLSFPLFFRSGFASFVVRRFAPPGPKFGQKLE